jgi:lipopolysaccharide export system protein LptA
MMTVLSGRALRSTVFPLVLVFASGAALAQAKKAPNPFQGFSSDNDQPVDVKSESLEVYQNEQKAIFVGNVVATQGESTLRSARLTVFYDNSGAPAPSQASAIKRLEADGNVIVTSADQKATGSKGVFDMTTNQATLTGDVVLNQGESVIRGKQLVVDMKTGVARVIGGTSGLFVPSKDQAAAGAKSGVEKPAVGKPKVKPKLKPAGD